MNERKSSIINTATLGAIALVTIGTEYMIFKDGRVGVVIGAGIGGLIIGASSSFATRAFERVIYRTRENRHRDKTSF